MLIPIDDPVHVLQLPALEKEVLLTLLPKDATDSRNTVLEIRAGTGGDEAALFAADLLRMYAQFCAHQGWRFEVGTPAYKHLLFRGGPPWQMPRRPEHVQDQRCDSSAKVTVHISLQRRSSSQGIEQHALVACPRCNHSSFRACNEASKFCAYATPKLCRPWLAGISVPASRCPGWREWMHVLSADVGDLRGCHGWNQTGQRRGVWTWRVWPAEVGEWGASSAARACH